MRTTTDVTSLHKNCVLAQCIILSTQVGGVCVCWGGGGVELELGPCKMHFLVLLLDIFSSGDKWRQFKYSFVYIQISPTSLILGNIFF